MEYTLSGVGVLDKAIVVLDSLRSGSHSLKELCDATTFPRATVYRLAVALELHGLVRRDENGNFLLGLGLIGLGQAAAVAFPLVGIARPVLEELRATTGESVQLYVAEGDHRRCVLSLQSLHGLRWIVPEGVLLTMELGSAARVLRGQVPQKGWVDSVEEREKGACSVSAPVLGAPDASGVRPIVAAVSVSGPIERLTRSPGKSCGPAVVASAMALSEAIQAALG
jgi:DNA-binding IclR family transcriptional regulator